MTDSQDVSYSFEATRMCFASRRSFDSVKAALLARMGEITIDEMKQIIATAVTSDAFERSVNARAGDSGFMLFFEIDYGRWLPLYGIRRKAVRLIFGNPAIAIMMLKHDLAAALFAPVELLLCEDEAGAGCSILYDLPSTLMQAEGKSELLAAARQLDAKVEALVSTAAGVA